MSVIPSVRAVKIVKPTLKLGDMPFKILLKKSIIFQVDHVPGPTKTSPPLLLSLCLPFFSTFIFPDEGAIHFSMLS